MRCSFALVLFFTLGCTDAEPPKTAVLAEGDTVKVIGIIKGDEISVERAAHTARVRLLGIYAFSAVVQEAQVAALSSGGVAALSALVLGQDVQLHFDQTKIDAAGRYLAYVEKSGVDVNQRLVEEGWAVVYTEFPFAREAGYFAVEAPARQTGKNLWSLKPAAELVHGLRRQWRDARGGASALVDPLL